MSKQQKLNYTQYVKAKKSQVEDIELNARYQKANWETMYYTIENEKIKAEYLEIMEKLKPSLDAEAQEFPAPPEDLVPIGTETNQQEVESV